MTTVKPDSHMPPMHLQHGHRYCLEYFSDMRTEGTAWDTFPIWKQKVLPGILFRYENRIGRMFSFVREVAQTVPAATSQIHRQHMTTRLNCVFSFPVNQFEIYFPGLLWEIVFGVITENWLHLIASPSLSFPPYFFLALFLRAAIHYPNAWNRLGHSKNKIPRSWLLKWV